MNSTYNNMEKKKKKQRVPEPTYSDPAPLVEAKAWEMEGGFYR